MRCPKCGADKYSIGVMDSRPKDDSVYRRRYCTKCGYRFTTYEITMQRKADIERRERKIEKFKDKVKQFMETM